MVITEPLSLYQFLVDFIKRRWIDGIDLQNLSFWIHPRIDRENLTF
jgi:hypothetical protein